ncbi:succinyl-CoA synthetase, alpha subunit [Pyrolobus fumarii 1A]|uniref:Succinate--CoA ligase [ADP-forming] subunit alpha n=1 Tax=Pyrolobus fumarii (strain DSM 11204 / 1A) TaxID=694429 RepID=G0EFX6_PYRF1|nr:succinate--CoA ligase subunit alpha [Pyrolobus fumarii]AEM39077.1 succinyl-CoA synthetase, alpha subunit [Pyrolobus fumarii 1A]
MPVLVGKGTVALVQGITGRYGSFHTKLMLEYGTRIVAGVTPGKGGENVHGVPVYDSVEEAVREHPEINSSIIFVPAPGAADAIIEAVDAGIKLIVVITEGIPIHDSLRAINYARSRGVRVIGPNCPGVITPGEAKLGIMPHQYFKPGNVGIVSRSGTLTYEIAAMLSERGIGQSTVIGVGGDPIIGTDLVEAVKLFNDDPQTDLVVVIGEIGGDQEERLAEAYKRGEIQKPLVAYVAGRNAPPGKRMGHAGAIVMGSSGTAEEKARVLQEAGIPVARVPTEVPDLVEAKLRELGKL